MLFPAPQRHNQPAAVGAGASFVERLPSMPLLLSSLVLQQRLTVRFLLLLRALCSIHPCW